jgi:hypothetical protein
MYQLENKAGAQVIPMKFADDGEAFREFPDFGAEPEVVSQVRHWLLDDKWARFVLRGKAMKVYPEFADHFWAQPDVVDPYLNDLIGLRGLGELKKPNGMQERFQAMRTLMAI